MKSQEATGADARGRVQGMGAISEGTGAKAEGMDAGVESAEGTSADAGDAMQIASNIKSCAMVLTSAPIICIYPFIQKYFVKGTLAGAVKG